MSLAKIVRLDPVTRDPLDPYVEVKSFAGEFALTDALYYWNECQVQSWGGPCNNPNRLLQHCSCETN